MIQSKAEELDRPATAMLQHFLATEEELHGRRGLHIKGHNARSGGVCVILNHAYGLDQSALSGAPSQKEARRSAS